MVATQIEGSIRTTRPGETQPPSEREEALRRMLTGLRAEVVSRVRALRASSSPKPEVVEEAAHEGAEATAPELQYLSLIHI